MVRKEFNTRKMVAVPAEKNYLHTLCEAKIKTFVTTNFDSVIEENTEIPTGSIYLPSNLIKSGDAIEAIRTGKGSLIKLHGTWDKLESIILTESKFDYTYRKENWGKTS